MVPYLELRFIQPNKHGVLLSYSLLRLEKWGYTAEH